MWQQCPWFDLCSKVRLVSLAFVMGWSSQFLTMGLRSSCFFQTWLFYFISACKSNNFFLRLTLFYNNCHMLPTISQHCFVCFTSFFLRVTSVLAICSIFQIIVCNTLANVLPLHIMYCHTAIFQLLISSFLVLPSAKPVGETEVLGDWVDVQGSTSRKW